MSSGKLNSTLRCGVSCFWVFSVSGVDKSKIAHHQNVFCTHKPLASFKQILHICCTRGHVSIMVVMKPVPVIGNLKSYYNTVIYVRVDS